MSDNINEILSPEAEKQLQELQEGLLTATEQIVKFGKAAKGITLDFKGVKDFQSLADVQTKVKETTEKMTGAAKFYNDTIQATDKIIAQHNGHSKEFVQVLKGVEDAKLKSARADEVRARTAERTAKQRNAELAREEKAMAKLNNAYEQLKIKYRDTANEAKRLGIEAENVANSLGKQSAEYKLLRAQEEQAAAAANNMYNSLLRVEKSVGQAQRQVGQYNTAAFAMSQILRETPAFAYSTATGFLAISNNIPILVDEIQKLKAANVALKAEGAATIPIWKTLMSAITSPAGLITIITAGITLLAAKTDIFKSEAKEASEATKNFEDSLKSLNSTMKNLNRDISLGIEEETQKAKLLLGVYNDSRTTLIGRINTYEELQGMYPKVLSALTDEEKATGALNLAHVKQIATLNEVIRAKTHLNKIDDAISEQRKVKADANQILREQANEFSDATKQAIRRAIRAQGDRLTHPTVSDPAAGVDNSAANKYLDIRDKVLAAERKIAQFEKIKYEYAIKYANVQKNINDEKGKSELLEGNQELVKAQYEYSRQQVEQDRDNQKDIVDDTKKSLQERLDAHLKYQTDLLQLAAMERDYVVKAEDEKIAELERKKKGASAIEQKNLEKQQDAAVVRQLTAQEDYNQKANKITLDGRKEVLNIVKTSNEEWLKIQSDSFEARKQAEIEQYLTEEKLLQHALETGQLTRRQHAKKVEELQRKQRITALQAEVEFDKRLLQNQQLTNEQQLALQKKLNSDEEALFRAQQGKKPRGKQTGRITDGIASLLGGAEFLKADLDEQQRYLQSFYDATVNLARAAADAIIQLNENRFKGELDNINRLQEANKLRYEEQVRAIDYTAANEIDRKNQLAVANAQFQAQEAEYEQEKRRIAQQQAKFQRTYSIAAAVSNTAVAITKALAELGPLAAVVIPIIAATGAAQVATIASAPIPKYAKGKKSHPGGLFWAGDGGEPEYVKAPNKPGYWTPPTSTLYNEKAGTSVTPLSKMVQNVNITGNYTPGSINEVAPHDIMYEHLANLIGEKFDETGQNLASFIARYGYKPQKQQNMGDAIRRIQNSQGF